MAIDPSFNSKMLIWLLSLPILVDISVSIAVYWAVVNAEKTPLILIENLTLLLVMQLQPFFVYPVAHTSQFVGVSTQLAQEVSHLTHLADDDAPERTYPALH